MTDAAISRKSGVTTGTLNRWRYENVRRPQWPTIRAILRAIGYELAAAGPGGQIIRFEALLSEILGGQKFPPAPAARKSR